MESTLHRLLLVELLVAALVLAAIGGLGLWVVRLGLRPLAAIGGTAAAIASGDLSQRVERAEPRTEVGRLGIALNAMLGADRIVAAGRSRPRSASCGGSSPTRRTSCVPHSRRSARTPSCSSAAQTRGPTISRGRCGESARESERMSVLVDDLLLLARLDEGRPLEREPIDLGALVGEAVETAHAVEPDRPVSLEAVPVVVLGDRVRLRQAIDNLLANVRAHTPPERR